MTDEARFLEALPVIDDVTGQVCRRHRLNAAETDDFRSDVRLHFIDKNYEVLRRFEGRCTLATYVTVVVQRLFLDWRNRLWGRWRPTTDARRMGPAAVLLERLVIRDGWGVEQAFEMIRVNHGVETDAALVEFSRSLAARAPARRVVAEEAAGQIPSAGPAADANVVRAEHDFLAKRVQAALDRARQKLAPLDRLVLKMRFEDRVAVADIARVLRLEQRPLYRTIERLLAAMGDSLAAEGISRSDIEALFANAGFGWAESGQPTADTEARAAAAPEKAARASWRSR